jgi:hypothetical protein
VAGDAAVGEEVGRALLRRAGRRRRGRRNFLGWRLGIRDSCLGIGGDGVWGRRKPVRGEIVCGAGAVGWNGDRSGHWCPTGATDSQKWLSHWIRIVDQKGIVDQGVKQVKAGGAFHHRGHRESVFSRRRCRASRPKASGPADTAGRRGATKKAAGGKGWRYKEGVAARRRKDYSPQGFAAGAGETERERKNNNDNAPFEAQDKEAQRRRGSAERRGEVVDGLGMELEVCDAG